MSQVKVVVLSSGGIDSTTALAKVLGTYEAAEVVALTLFYGQRHDKEIQAAREVADYYGVMHIEHDLSSVFNFSNSPLLSRSTGEVPFGSYAESSTREDDGMSKTYVPYRNGLMLSVATAIAYSLGASSVVYGAHADDAAGNAYPDCSTQFATVQGDAIYEGTGKKVKLEAPFITMNKAGIVATGLDLEVPYDLTWSCYVGEEKACGKCGTCVDRQAAFILNDTTDPIEYQA